MNFIDQRFYYDFIALSIIKSCKKFFQSQYFHREKLANEDEKSIFANCDSLEDKELSNQARNSLVNLERIFDMDYMNEYAENEITQKLNDKKQKAALTKKEAKKLLVKRINNHATQVLQSCQK